MKKGSLQPNDKLKILHIESVHKFYAMEKSNVKKVGLLETELNAFCKNMSEPRQRLYVPEIGQLCAVEHTGKWFRGRVEISLKNGKYEIFLLDHGVTKTIDWKQMNILDDQFTNLPENIMQLCLFNQNSAQIESLNMDKVNKQFDGICKNTKYFTMECGFNGETLLFALDTNGTQSCVNETLIKCSEISQSSEQLQPIGDSFAKLEIVQKKATEDNKMKIVMTHSESPEEFYIRLESRQMEFEKLHQRIQKYCFGKSDQFKCDLGDYCFALNSNDKCWYRGYIFKIEGDIYSIFLRDSGKRIEVKRDHLLVANDDLLASPCSTIRCHLAFIKPSGNVMTYTMLDKFRSFQKQELYINVPDITDITTSVPIILWGRTEKKQTLDANTIKWTNLNLVLVYEGVARCTHRIDSVKSCAMKHDFGDFDENGMMREIIYKKNDANILPMYSSALKRWAPAEPIHDRIFEGIPVHVDSELNIYVLEQKKYLQLQKMSAEMSEELVDCDYVVTSWKPRDMCIAKYVDGSLQRAEVKFVAFDRQICKVINKNSLLRL